MQYVFIDKIIYNVQLRLAMGKTPEAGEFSRIFVLKVSNL